MPLALCSGRSVPAEGGRAQHLPPPPRHLALPLCAATVHGHPAMHPRCRRTTYRRAACAPLVLRCSPLRCAALCCAPLRCSPLTSAFISALRSALAGLRATLDSALTCADLITFEIQYSDRTGENYVRAPVPSTSSPSSYPVPSTLSSSSSPVPSTSSPSSSPTRPAQLAARPRSLRLNPPVSSIASSFLFDQFARHGEGHRWYYFPEMTIDEALLIKCWDSAGSVKRPAIHHESILFFCLVHCRLIADSGSLGLR